MTYDDKCYLNLAKEERSERKKKRKKKIKCYYLARNGEI